MHFNIWWILGIIGGNIFLLQKSISPFCILLIGTFILGIGYAYYYGILKSFIMGMTIGVSLICFINQPIHTEKQWFKMGTTYEIVGSVKEIKRTEYYSWITLSDVRVKTKPHPLKSNIQVRASLEKTKALTAHDKIYLSATLMEDEPQMNPSDMDYIAYLRSQNIGATFKAEEIQSIKQKELFSEKGKNVLEDYLKTLYSKQKVGILEAVLLGDDTKLEKETKSLYNQSGMSHVLCISGFHVGVIMGFVTFILRFIGAPYTFRHLLSILSIWAYAYFTGYGTSTIRATVMMTVLLIGRCLWQEEDRFINLSIASLLILIFAPYQLFQAGFQLSFMAVLGIECCLNEIEKKEWFRDWRFKKWQKSLLIWLWVQVATWPVLAYHFYEIPFLISLMNLLIIPIFSCSIIGGWMSLGLYMLHLPIALDVAKGIEGILSGIEWAIEYALKWPLATYCTGRPQLWQFIAFALAVGLVMGYLFEYISKYRLYKSILMMSILGTCLNLFRENPLSLTSLYVGQGDSTVVITPYQKVMVIDGGNFGQGKVVERYIKYKGLCHINALIISHSDADHMGGALELLETNLKIHKVLISESDHSEPLQSLLQICKEKQVPVYRVKAQDQVLLDSVQMTCLAPIHKTIHDNINDNSMVFSLNYGAFTALFTGDKSKNSDTIIYESMEPISLLKVSHHGSRTGTSNSLLLKLQPRYAMISCGRNNRYGHPHKEVVDLLEAAEVNVSRIDLEGAICYETDGYYLKEIKYRKDA